MTTRQRTPERLNVEFRIEETAPGIFRVTRTDHTYYQTFTKQLTTSDLRAYAERTANILIAVVDERLSNG